MTMVTETVTPPDRRQGYERRHAHLPWYKSKEARLNIILITLWITTALLVSIAYGVHNEVKLNRKIEGRQAHQRERVCLVIKFQQIPDPSGLCSDALIQREDGGG